MWTRHRTYLISAGTAVLGALLLWLAGGDDFARFFGPLPAPLVVPALAALGYWALTTLDTRGYRTGSMQSGPLAARIFLGGLALSALPISIDLIQPFSAGINIPSPRGLIFYPVMAVVAEVQFHLLPLALLALVLPRARPSLWLVLPVALIEPAFQVVLGGGPALQSGLVALHVGIFNLVQLWLFFRNGFLAMILLRLGFYLGWHVIWGAARLELLF